MNIHRRGGHPQCEAHRSGVPQPLRLATPRPSLQVAVEIVEDENPHLRLGALTTLHYVFDEQRQYYTYDLPEAVAPPSKARVFAAAQALTPPLLADNVNYFGRVGGLENLLRCVEAFEGAWTAGAAGGSGGGGGDGEVPPASSAGLAVLQQCLLPLMTLLPLLARDIQVALANKVRPAPCFAGAQSRPVSLLLPCTPPHPRASHRRTSPSRSL